MFIQFCLLRPVTEDLSDVKTFIIIYIPPSIEAVAWIRQAGRQACCCWQSVSESVRLGFESLIGSHGHILICEGMFVCCLSWGAHPDGWVGLSCGGGGHSLCLYCVFLFLFCLLFFFCMLHIYGLITNDVSDYINLLVRIAHIICNHPLYNYI
jgi:hypothetical protein